MVKMTVKISSSNKRNTGNARKLASDAVKRVSSNIQKAKRNVKKPS